ncbi:MULTISPECIES: beta-ketoacyl-ACP synthase III [Kytococcus]|uniref:Beta-ketoacyl-[acyl-carrier-protein] synthase III n=1 Tax=Kytococcus schroeteri TaxID=138300 RepID=A0A2I1PB72_9MICO|nr:MULTISPECIES: beta-ketoacyl-ACP synthase III [Kytococcus]OFS15881.1 3-oxoacyl-ACP synthase [Kytococcus sp. HMSC28H12]PKZ41867.1 ketoacyl-ACP synthase III [Kytococcus schroeteri]
MQALRTQTTLRPAAITGVGAYRPSRVVPNDELVEAIDSSDEWIQQRTGIVERRWATEEDTTLSMATAAAREALEAAGITGEQIGAVVVATVSNPMRTPGVAPMLAAELGSQAPAFDLSAACAGYCHGIALANDMVGAGTADHVLVVGVEYLSQFTDLSDRGTAFLFADAAGAAVVSLAEASGISPTVWGSDGSQWELIRTREDGMLTMTGNSVFRWAVWEMAKVARRAMEAAGVTAEELDVFIPHQANARITAEMVKQLKLPESVRVADDIRHTGNTSAASVPVATARMLAEGQARSGDIALQFGFGAGLVYAAQVVRLP